MDSRARLNPGVPWVLILSFALVAGFCRPVGAQASALTAAELRKKLAEAPEPEAVSYRSHIVCEPGSPVLFTLPTMTFTFQGKIPPFDIHLGGGQNSGRPSIKG